MLKGIKSRVLFLTLAPVVITALVLSTYFATSQLLDTESELNERGITLTRYIATASEYGVFAGNPELFTPIIESALNEDNVVSITITDDQGKVLFNKTNPAFTNKAPQGSEKHNPTIFRQPISQSTLELDEITALQQGDTQASPNILGHVYVEYSSAQMIKRQKNILLSTLLITLFGISISIILALHFSEKITGPILRLTKNVQDIESGKLDTDIEVYSPDEIGALERGVQSMLTAIKGAQEHLQREIKQATGELERSLQLLGKQNQELYNARQQALEASKTKSAFLANMSHEIRTPMNGILGFIRLLRDSGLKDTQNTYLDIVEVSANNLLSLINDILDISKIEAGKLSLRIKEFNLSHLIEDTLTLLAPSANEKGIELVSIIYDDLPVIIESDPDRIRQVILNLLSNAIKFSSQGTIVLRAMLDHESKHDYVIRLSVSDEGIGIPDSEKHKLFSQFSQIENSPTLTTTGTGLGLAISKSLVQMMGGEIGVTDNQPKGSVFWFSFHTTKAKPVVKTVNDEFSTRGRRVLIFDENKYARLSCKHLLAPYLVELIECDTKDCLLEVAKSEQPDVIFCGFQINQQTAIAKQLSQLREFCLVPIILMTNSTDPMVMLAFRDFSPIKYLPKPISSRELKAALSFALSPEHTENTDEIHKSRKTISAKSTAQQYALSGLRILIAEDNEINLRLLKEILSGLGAEVSTVKNGREAILLCQAQTFDVILMDIQMPEVNGIDATKEIRRMESAGKPTPIIGITASLFSDEEQTYLSSGMDAVFLKPVVKEELLQAIDTLLDLKTIRFTAQNDTRGPGNDTQNSSAAAQPEDILPTFAHPRDILKKQLPEVRANMENARKDNDWQKLRELLHKFVGGIAYCELPHLKQLADTAYNHLCKQTSPPEKELDLLLEELRRLEQEGLNNPGD